MTCKSCGLEMRITQSRVLPGTGEDGAPTVVQRSELTCLNPTCPERGRPVEVEHLLYKAEG